MRHRFGLLQALLLAVSVWAVFAFLFAAVAASVQA